jgi:hypothetical protein
MIDIHYNLATNLPRLAQSTVIKTGGDVPVRLNFSAAPGDVTSIELALGTDSSSPETLAHTDGFEQENSTTWLAMLDANDNRLLTFMAGKQVAQVQAELICLIDGKQLVSPNLPVTVQPKILSGPGSTEGGPHYFTAEESDARYGTRLVSMLFFGELIEDQLFGFFKAPTAYQIIGAQIAAQIAPEGADVTVDLVNALNAEQGRIATLADGSSAQETIFGTPLQLAAGTIIRAKILTTGTTQPGGYLNLNLITIPAAI